MDFCTSCGQPLKEGSAFCSNCGAARAAVTGQAAPSDPVGQDAPAEAPVPFDGAPVPPMTPAPDNGTLTTGKSGRALLLASGALVVVAAIVVGLLFVLGAFKDQEGASSPEGAVSNLLNAAVTFKPSNAVKLITPSEVDGFSGLEKAALSPAAKGAAAKFNAQVKSQMEQLTSTPGMSSILGPEFAALSNISHADLQGALKAVSVKLSNMQYTTTNLATGIADVAIDSGDITVAADSAKIPADLRQRLSTLLRGSSGVPSWVTDLLNGTQTVSHTWHIGDWSKAAAGKGQKLDLIVVKQDGGWYVSIVGTIAQHVYEGVTYDRQQNRESPLAQPNWNLYANPPQPIVARSPRQVPANIAKAFSDKSVMEIFRNLPQGEVRPLFPYAPMLQTAADSGSGASDVFSLAISGVRAITTGTDGDLTHVIYTQGAATVTQNGKSKSASVHNGCYTADGNQQCVSQWPDFAQNLAKAFGIDKGIPVTLKHVNGGYQLDPVGTVADLVSSAMIHADQLIAAYREFMTQMMQQLQQFNSQYGGSSSGSSSLNCYDSSGNYVC